MAELTRIGPTATIAGVGRVFHGATHTVPDALVTQLLATGEWATPDNEVVVGRLTEVPTSTPATAPTPQPNPKPKAKPKRK